MSRLQWSPFILTTGIVHPKNYAHILHIFLIQISFVVFRFRLFYSHASESLECHWANVVIFECLWSNPDTYGWIDQMGLTTTITISGLVQERRNPIANALDYIFLALIHRYNQSKIVPCAYVMGYAIKVQIVLGNFLIHSKTDCFRFGGSNANESFYLSRHRLTGWRLSLISEGVVSVVTLLVYPIRVDGIKTIPQNNNRVDIS